MVDGDSPVRVFLLRVAEEDYIAGLVVHHLVADGWAVRVLVRDLCDAYAAYRLGAPPAAEAADGAPPRAPERASSDGVTPEAGR